MITHEDHLPPKVDCHTDFIPGIGIDFSFSFPLDNIWPSLRIS